MGVSHAERAYVAVAILSGYGGAVDDGIRAVVKGLLAPSQLRRAEILGRTLRLGHRFSAGAPEILAQARVRIGEDALRLEILSAERMPDSDAVQARLRQLAIAGGVQGAEVIRT